MNSIRARNGLSRHLLIGAGLAAATLAAFAFSAPAMADPFSFSTGDPDGRMATTSRPSGAGKIETETADDFVLGATTTLNQATFTGLLPLSAPLSSIVDIVVEIYRVFPNDSNTARTPTVPTRVNSPSDVEFVGRSLSGASLSFSTSVLNTSFTAANSVLNGIHPFPNQTTGGEGSVTGQEVRFTVTFTSPITLDAGHYFFVPQVELNSSGNFFWLSAAGPTLSSDLQSWIRNADLDPDWLRIGTDIVGGVTPPRFNAAFSLSGDTLAAVPGPIAGAGLPYLILAGGGILGWRRRRRLMPVVRLLKLESSVSHLR
jgi:hypothetical protein